MEAAKVDANGDFAGGDAGDGAAGTPAFTTIYDGDLDGDGIPNFLDLTTMMTTYQMLPTQMMIMTEFLTCMTQMTTTMESLTFVGTSI